MEDTTHAGVSGFNLGLGGWITPRAALTARIASTGFSQDVEVNGKTETGRFSSGFVGASLQYHVTDAAFLGGGIGLAGWATPDEDEGEGGFGFDLRAGINVWTGQSWALHLAAEVTPLFFEHGSVTGFGVQLGLQYL